MSFFFWKCGTSETLLQESRSLGCWPELVHLQTGAILFYRKTQWETPFVILIFTQKADFMSKETLTHKKRKKILPSFLAGEKILSGGNKGYFNFARFCLSKLKCVKFCCMLEPSSATHQLEESSDWLVRWGGKQFDTDWANDYKQVRLFSRNDVKPFMFNSAIGHYSQLVWAETYKVQGSQVPQLPWMSLPEASGLGNLTR